MFAAGIQRIPSTLWQSLADAGHVTLDLPVEFFPAKLGKSPVLWSRAEVQLWVDWCSHEFSLSNVNVTEFDMNGKALCLLTKGDFFDRVPHVGDVLYNTLRTLLHKPYNHVNRGDDEVLAERDYTPVQPWRRLTGDQDDTGWRERPRSSGHNSNIGDRKEGELREAFNPTRGECDGMANHHTIGDVIPRSSVQAEEPGHLQLNGRRVTVDEALAAHRLEHTVGRHKGDTGPIALDLSQTSRPSSRSFGATEQRNREEASGQMNRMDERQWNTVGDAKVTERHDPHLCLPPPCSTSSPLTAPLLSLNKAEPRPWTATPPRSYPEVLAGYMTSPTSSVATNGDVKPRISSDEMVSNHRSVGSHVTIGGVKVPDAAGRPRDLRLPVLAPFPLKQQPQNNVYCSAVQEGIGCRTEVTAPLRVPNLAMLPPKDILEQKDTTKQPLDTNGRHMPDKKDGRLLWEFLNDLLVDGRHGHVIRWENRQTRTFIIVDPAGLATLWGEHKRRPHMTYEKMSRAMRYYYDMQIIRRVPGRRLTYSFMQEPCDIQRGVRGAKRGVPHARRRCTSERHNAPKLISIAAKIVVNAGQNEDDNEMHSNSNGHNAICQNGEKASEKAGDSTDKGVALPRRDCVCHTSYGEFGVDGVNRPTSITDDGRSEVSRQPGDLERNGNRESDIDTANPTRTRCDIRECETVACPDDVTLVDNRVSGDSCATVSPGSKKRQRGSAGCDIHHLKRRISVAVSSEAL